MTHSYTESHELTEEQLAKLIELARDDGEVCRRCHDSGTWIVLMLICTVMSACSFALGAWLW